MSLDLGTLEADAAKIGKALEYAQQIDFAAAAKAFETANLAGEIQTVEDVMQVVGVFVPPVAVAANDLAAAVAGFDLLLQFANGKIPQTTLDTEENIEERFERPFKQTPSSV
ncbi:MAG TPA: hypothetical protein VKA03_05945 [Methylovirgula sp.]|nr:hypothetical protein [Methylovirgula sp.]